MLDIVETVDFLINQVVLHTGKTHHRPGPHTSGLFLGTNDCFLRRSMRNAMELPFEDEGTSQEPVTNVYRLDGTLPAVELAESLGFGVKYIQPLKEELVKRPSRTPTPDLCSRYLDSDQLLFLLMTSLKEGCWTMFELLETFLCLVADFSPACGAVPSSLVEIIIQCYRRFNLLSSDLCHDKYIRLHVLMDEL
ncbi:unnamed protein product, partial [Strongylus vulgaris]